jgi:hypothetical protein
MKMRWLTAIFAVALAIRLGFLAAIWPQLNPDADIDWYRSLALNLAAGNGYIAGPDAAHALPLLTRTPSYPLFLAGLIKLGGDRLAVFLVAQCILGAMTCALTAQLTARWVRNSLAALAGALVAIDPNSVARCADLRDETLFAFLLIAGMLLLVRRGEGYRRWALAAVVWSAAALCRPGMAWLGAFPIIAGLMAHIRWRSLAVFIALYLAVLGIWGVRNYAVTGQWMLSSAVTENLLLQRAAGVEASRSGVTREQAREQLYKRFGDVEFFHSRESLAANLQAYRGAALDVLASSPAITARHLARDWMRVLFAPGKASLAHMMREPPTPARWWPPIYSAALVILVGLAAFGAFKLGRQALLISLLVPYLVLFSLGSSRFRTQITPALAVLAVAGAEAVWRKSWRRASS